ncbi:FG-GAP repeat domain-containing protein [Pseudopelagicola sp. nBUS_19]|uniref:FG-GAP repeat domain-containing protein n=1 Tax=unclassified Pseudopelagicola TaxID=2649563 RepID=UPI003EB6D899
MLCEALRLALQILQSRVRRASQNLCILGAFWALTETAQAEILSAWYDEPTTRYTHGVLGDIEEWGALVLKVSTCADCAFRKVVTFRFVLPQSRVFEDLEPRLIDLDNDGTPEVVVIESDADQGSALVVYDESGRITQTPHIGQRNRWLAPIGAADFDGDGRVELAYIDRPHLAKTLRVWRYDNDQLGHVVDKSGLTNHRIGEDYISGGIRICGDTPEIVTVNSDWTRIMATTLSSDRLTSRVVGIFDGPESLKDALDCVY